MKNNSTLALNRALRANRHCVGLRCTTPDPVLPKGRIINLKTEESNFHLGTDRVKRSTAGPAISWPARNVLSGMRRELLQEQGNIKLKML